MLLKPRATYNSYSPMHPRKRRGSGIGRKGRLMDFVRRRKRGQDKKVRRTWFSEEGYRIVWRKEVHGVRVPARFQACVRILIPYSDGELRQMWDFVNRHRRLIKTLKAARKSARRHQTPMGASVRGRRRPGLARIVRRQAAPGLAPVGEEENGPPAVCHPD